MELGDGVVLGMRPWIDRLVRRGILLSMKMVLHFFDEGRFTEIYLSGLLFFS